MASIFLGVVAAAGPAGAELLLGVLGAEPLPVISTKGASYGRQGRLNKVLVRYGRASS